MKEKRIIKTRWETDAYKLSMGMIFWLFFKNIIAKFVFVDRQKMPYIPGMVERMKAQVQMVADLPALMDRADFVKRKWPWMNWLFLVWYANHKFDPSQVKIWAKDGVMHIEVVGPIYEVTYWEIFLLRIYSCLYTEMSGRLPKPGWQTDALGRARFYFERGVPYVEGGGRRPFNAQIHWEALALAAKYAQVEKGGGGLMGTSWIEYAFQLDIMMFGTQAHEYTSFMGALYGHEVANAKAMEVWVKTYGTKLGYVLPDSYGLKDFEEAFTFGYADLFTGSRHDSGPFKTYIEWILGVYRDPLRDINPVNKYVVHSNSIRHEDEAIEMMEYRRGEYIRSFLFGGQITNNVGYDAYNTVIKLWSLMLPEGESFAVKVPDQISKAVGDPATVRKVLIAQGRA
jgi:nicotinate phosphoribosyltransferase